MKYDLEKYLNWYENTSHWSFVNDRRPARGSSFFLAAKGPWFWKCASCCTMFFWSLKLDILIRLKRYYVEYIYEDVFSKSCVMRTFERYQMAFTQINLDLITWPFESAPRFRKISFKSIIPFLCNSCSVKAIIMF